MSLPELVVFSVRDSSNEDRYLSFTGPQRQLQFGVGETVYSDIARFAVEPAGSGLVHIRSTYENRYWARASRFESWLMASSQEKEEDMSKDECTLFRPRISAGNVFVSFTHPSSGLNVVMRPPTDAHAYNLSVEQTAATEFSLIDFAPLSQTRLPKYVMFIGDNGKYLSPKSTREDWAFLHFGEYDNPTARAVGFETFYHRNGDFVRFKSMSLDYFWQIMLPGRRIVITPFPPADMFFDVVVSSRPNPSENGIAIRSQSLKQYCHRVNNADQEFSVGSNTPNTLNAWLRPTYVATPNKGRVNIEGFRHAWTGPKTTRLLKEKVYTNASSTEVELTVPTEYQARTTTTFGNSFSLVRGHQTVFNGQMPSVLSSGELNIPDAATNVNAAWGVPNTNDNGPTAEDIKLVLPPMSIVRATLSVKIAIYEVPFSYEQIDEFPFGGTERQHLHDGVYKIEAEYGVGVSYNIQPLTSKEGDLEEDIVPNASLEVNNQD